MEQCIAVSSDCCWPGQFFGNYSRKANFFWM